MKKLFLIALLVLGKIAANAQYVQKWEPWMYDLFLTNHTAKMDPLQRNLGLQLWQDKGFGMELHWRNTWGTAIYTRANSEAIWLGNYGYDQNQQQGFSPWMTLLGGKVGIGTTDPQVPLDVIGDMRISKSIITNTGSGQQGSGHWALRSNNTLRFGMGLLFDETGGSNGADFSIWRYGDDGSYLDNAFLIKRNNGFVGLGTAYPSEKLEVAGSTFVNGESVGYIIDAHGQKRIGLMKYAGREGGIWRTTNQDFEIGRVNVDALPGNPSSFQTDLYVGGNGSVGVGTTNVNDEAYKLFVEAGVRTRKVKVDQVRPWPDYVFEPAYQLPSLNDVEAFIKQHKHLPEVPSAKEVEEKGLDLGDNQATLLKKVEELTLYLIEVNKKVEQLQAENVELKKQLKD